MSEILRLFPEPDPRDADEGRIVEAVRIAEALLFAAIEPMPETELARRLPAGAEVSTVLARLKRDYETRGVRLVRVGDKWIFRTAEDLGWLLSASARESRKLSRAALETLAIIAYHQPTTRADIESIRGVAVAKGTLDVLMEAGWIKPRGRRRAPGLRGAGFFDDRLPPTFSMPLPRDGPLGADEEPLDDQLDDETRSDDHEAELDDVDLDEGDSLDRNPFA